jgi:hypothetical protein
MPLDDFFSLDNARLGEKRVFQTRVSFEDGNRSRPRPRAWKIGLDSLFDRLQSVIKNVSKPTVRGLTSAFPTKRNFACFHIPETESPYKTEKTRRLGRRARTSRFGNRRLTARRGFLGRKAADPSICRPLLVPHIRTFTMAAITISAPIVAKAPVAMRRTRVTARAAVAPAASTSAVSFGARKMMTGASVQAARVQQTAAGRKSLVWCVSRPDTPPESTPVERAFVPSSRARASLDRTSGWASRAARGRPIAQGFGSREKARTRPERRRERLSARHV